MTDARLSVGGSRPLLLSVVIAGAFLWTLQRIQIVDTMPDQGLFAKYTALAQRALAGDLPIDRLGDVSTGYLWSVVFLSGPLGLTPFAIRTLQIVLVTVAALLCGAAVWRRWGAAAGLTSTCVVLMSRGALLNATEIEPETMILVLVSAALALVVAHESPLATGAAAVLLGLAAVFRPSTILPTTLLATGVIFFSAPRRRVRTAVVFLAGGAAPLLLSKIATFLLIGFWPPAMNPGTVFFEGWNPAATGYLGEAPAVVKDVEHGLALPDGLHVAYRIVAARATGAEPSPASANRYWAARALASIRHQPTAAISRLIRKGLYSIHSYDAWDLATMPRKSSALPLWPWIPFGFAVALAALGATWGRTFPKRSQVALFAIGCWVTMVLFYVTARQRNVVVPAIAILCGLAVHEAMRRWRSDSRRSVALAIAAVAVAGTLLTLNGSAQREDLHTWSLRFAAEKAHSDAARAENAGRPFDRDNSLARAATLLDREALLSAPSALIQQHVRAELGSRTSPERRFDLALVLSEIGQLTEASSLLEDLQADGYKPRRGARITSSVAYHLARCRLALGDREGAITDLRRALEEAPGEARPLALFVLMTQDADPENAAASARELEQVHDRFTATLASARAWMDLGRPDLGSAAFATVDAALPEGRLSRRRSW